MSESNEKRLFLGNEAVARGLYEAGCKVVSSYPGTPSTEITEYAAEYDEIYCEWAPNEKVAAEVAIGASFGGARAFCGMKHVGLNVAADPIFTASYTGVGGGLVIGVADDPGMHSSQNEQDSRHYAVAAKLLMLEPADSAECRDFAKTAFDLSEQFDTPVVLRLTTRISHSRTPIESGERVEVALKPYEKNAAKRVMVPANSRMRHIAVEQRMKALVDFAETTPLNKIEKGGKIGIITSGITYQYAKEALGDKASYLKLGVVNPLPVELIKKFASSVDELYVLEELDDVIETHCVKIGVACKGKELFSLCGEYTANAIKKVILDEEVKTLEAHKVPNRPPVLCPGCPHRGIFHVLSSMKLYVSGDIGCYSLGAAPPLAAMDSIVCMGASISALHGFNVARGDEFSKRAVAVIGDSTFMHSGMTGLCDIAYNKGISTVLILDNRITGMTGHQPNPLTGRTIKGEPTVEADLELLCKAFGIKRVRTVDPFDLEGCKTALTEELAAAEPSVIIVRRPCVLLKEVKLLPPVKILPDKCKKCKACLKLGCPAIVNGPDGPYIDQTLCTGCGLCKSVCKFDAIV
ncbi:MAG TPA: indolepyruvate ferredoxin oxidoreductase subunit alpha [Oscillospiraceae bacterium]|nr:indolepyruvate ferredoxin oxidoreductase subunit alpha [Oscillospiraceae bacterium]HPF55961.1 indolepyruvate ferredoxin oxidoreductase subunit alpha [Clostridiales bacterium]HPK35203.1 indolepyruvate ferredoxin oxidoreductase subunit alpha [Oscillospiraceae bacterium]HPR75006.1 indolepyruvate ferredoxin oxidoreductase subunit alpha [Oscillospiraceae bacterium]